MQSGRATVGENSLAKISRLFDGHPRTILQELLQNARRSGSPRVEIEITRLSDSETAFSFADEGPGIPDLTSFLTLTASGWGDDIQEAEDPAGMGLFCLASLPRVEVRSGEQRAVLTPEAFRGIPYEVLPAARVAGTKIKTVLPFGMHEVERHIRDAVRWADMRVLLNGDALPSARLVDEAGAVLVDEDLGVRLAVGETGYGYSCYMLVNFRGVTVRHSVSPRLAEVMTEAGAWEIQVELLHCRKLQMVLPARNAMYVNEHLAALELLAERAVYKWLEKKGQHALPYALWLRAKELGVELPDASFHRLHPVVGNRITAEPVVVRIPSDSVWDNSELTSPLGYTLVYPRRAYEGYESYDRLKVAHVSLEADGVPVDSMPEPGVLMRHDAVELVLAFTDGVTEEIRMPRDVVVLRPERECYWDSRFSVLATREFGDPDFLEEALTTSIFEPREDWDSDYAEGEEASFRASAARWAHAALGKGREFFEEEVREKLRWRLTNIAELIGPEGLTIRAVAKPAEDLGAYETPWQITFDYGGDR